MTATCVWRRSAESAKGESDLGIENKNAIIARQCCCCRAIPSVCSVHLHDDKAHDTPAPTNSLVGANYMAANTKRSDKQRGHADSSRRMHVSWKVCRQGNTLTLATSCPATHHECRIPATCESQQQTSSSYPCARAHAHTHMHTHNTRARTVTPIHPQAHTKSTTTATTNITTTTRAVVASVRACACVRP